MTARATVDSAGITAAGNTATVSTAAATPPAARPPPPAPAVVTAEPPRTTPPPELRAAGTGGPHADRCASARPPRAHEAKARRHRSPAASTAGKRTDYDSARRFLAQAEAAVKENNLLLAESSVEKAETLADGLR